MVRDRCGGDGAWLTISCDDIPRCRIERYRCQRKEEGRFGRIDEGTETHVCQVVVEDKDATFMHGQKIYVQSTVL